MKKQIKQAKLALKTETIRQISEHSLGGVGGAQYVPGISNVGNNAQCKLPLL